VLCASGHSDEEHESLEFYQQAIPLLLEGLGITLQLTAGGCLLAVFLSLMAGLGRISKFPPFRWTAVGYIEIFRGTSALVQLFWFFYVLPLFGIHLPAVLVGILVLGFNAGAYGGEVVRGAIQAVPSGQREAAISLNFSPFQRLWRIIIPQAVMDMLPPFGNIFIELLKNTALVSFITLTDLTLAAQQIRQDTMRTKEVFMLILVVYFIIALCITAMMRGLEQWLGRGLDRGGIRL
jgi:polar amino acid transport system permease protein